MTVSPIPGNEPDSHDMAYEADLPALPDQPNDHSVLQNEPGMRDPTSDLRSPL